VPGHHATQHPTPPTSAALPHKHMHTRQAQGQAAGGSATTTGPQCCLAPHTAGCIAVLRAVMYTMHCTLWSCCTDTQSSTRPCNKRCTQPCDTEQPADWTTILCVRLLTQCMVLLVTCGSLPVVSERLALLALQHHEQLSCQASPTVSSEAAYQQQGRRSAAAPGCHCQSALLVRFASGFGMPPVSRHLS
jgi:hypothetical protein